MLSAFKAQSIYELKPRDKSKIESLLAYGDRLLIGLNSGTLRVCRVNEADSSLGGHNENGDVPAATRARAVEVLREEEKFSKRPIQQLAVVKEANLLISLSDGHVSLHELSTYELVERLEATKGATCFTVTSNIVQDPDTDIRSLVSRLAVGVKRKVLCWEWREMEQMPDVMEISLESAIKSLVWATGKDLVVGMDSGFSVVDAETQEVTPINKPASRAAADAKAGETELAGIRFGAVSSSGMGYMGMSSWVPKPMATPLSDGHVLLAKDVNSLFIDSKGHALEKRQVPWSLAPEAIGYSYPYLLGLLPPDKGSLQIRNPDSLSLLQSIAVPNASILHVPQSNISLAHLGKGFLVASDRAVWRMNALGYDPQLAELVERQRYDEAISLLNLLEDTLIHDKAGKIRETMTQKAILLFQQQKYRAALDLFIDAQSSPQRVIALFPPSIAGNLSDQAHDQNDRPIENGQAQDEPAQKEQPPTPSKSLFGRVAGDRQRSGSDASAETTSPRKPGNTKSNGVEHRPLEGDDLKLAVSCLRSFLAQARVEIQKYVNFDGTLKEQQPTFDAETRKPVFANLLPASVFETKDMGEVEWSKELQKTAQLVDTTLFRSFMLASPSLAGSLFRLDNFCDPDVVKSSLYESGRYSDLIDFLHGKKLHRQALEMLAKFGKGEAEGEIPDRMLGPERVVGYLKQLPPESINLILEFAKWPLDTKPEIGMDIFLADTDNAERLPRHRVLEFLSNIDEDLQTQYLEHIINELGDTTPEFHQQLVDLYLLKLKGNSTSAETISKIKENLEKFLANSKSYNQAQTLRQLPNNDSTFYESRALVLSALGDHKEALSVYVFQLHDYARAEAYCNKTYLAQQVESANESQRLPPSPSHRRTSHNISQSSDLPPNIYATLLGLYLSPPAPEPKRWPEALALLSSHGARLPASSTLELMPADLGVHELRDYFRGRLRSATAQRRQERVVRALEAVRNTDVERKLLLGTDDEIAVGTPAGRNRRVVIKEGDVCPVCHRRFGTSAVRVFPDGVTVHYGCGGRRVVGDDSGEGRKAGLRDTQNGWR